MRICFLAPANSAHVIKWSRYFLSRGHEVFVISFTRNEIPGAKVFYLSTGAEGDSSDAKKLNYLLKAGTVRSLIPQIRPDIVNVHYATSYGTVAALAGLKNYVLSVWGSDIFDFPRKSPLHRAMLKYSLKKATYLFSTSRAMAEEAAKYTDKSFEITPFGVDTALFSPEKRQRSDGDFVVGTVKSLSHDYGIDSLLKAIALVRGEHPEIPIKVRIAGKGPDEKKLKALSVSCGLEEIVTWLGFISQEEAAREWADFDLAVIYSRNESFGVAAVEAQACACPVIISDIPGLMEATKPGVTSLVVEKENERALADAIYELYQRRDLRMEMGRSGREFVQEQYEYRTCFEKIERLFAAIPQYNNQKVIKK